MKKGRWKKVIIFIVVFIGLLLVVLSFGHKRLYTEIEINASDEKVWKVLSDLNSYQQWNPFIQRASGELHQGQTLHMRIHNGSLTLDPFDPTLVKVEQNREINWLGKAGNIPRIFDGNHHLIIEPIANDRVKFIQYEDFNGILVPIVQLFQSKMYEDTLEGYKKMNEALKVRAEKQ